MLAAVSVLFFVGATDALELGLWILVLIVLMVVAGISLLASGILFGAPTSVR